MSEDFLAGAGFAMGWFAFSVVSTGLSLFALWAAWCLLHQYRLYVGNREQFDDFMLNVYKTLVLFVALAVFTVFNLWGE